MGQARFFGSIDNEQVPQMPKIKTLFLMMLASSLAFSGFNRPDPKRDWDWENPNSLNLYQYVRNNPTNANDPSGLQIEIDKKMKPEQRSNLIITLQKLTDDKLIFDKDLLVIAERSEANDKPMGTELIRRLHDTEKKIAITMRLAGNFAKPKDKVAASNGQGSDVMVNFAPDGQTNFQVKDPVSQKASPEKDTPAQIKLGHELIHADHATRGTRHPDHLIKSQNITHASGRQLVKKVKLEELATVGLESTQKGDITENHLRKEQGLPPRVNY